MKLISLLHVLMITGTISCEEKGVVRLVVRVGEDVVLPCSLGPEKNIELAVFDWMKGRQEVFLYNAGFHQSEDPQFQGRVSHFPDKLKNGNASIIIRNIQLSDSGNYSCYFPRLQEQRFHVELLVDLILKPRPEIEGAAPQPIVTLNKTNDGMLLKCAVKRAFPKPEVQWRDSDGNIVPADELQVKRQPGNKYDVILTFTVIKAGFYRCVATQKDIGHQIYTETYAPGLDRRETDGASNGLTIGVLIAALVVVLIVAVVFGVLYFRQHKRPRSIMRAKPQETRELELEAEPDEDLKRNFKQCKAVSSLYNKPNNQPQFLFNS